MPSNTIYNPLRTLDFTKDMVLFSGKSIYFDAATNAVTEADLTLTDDMLLTGGQLLVKGGDIHDVISLQIVHPTLGVVSEFVTDWHINPDQTEQFILNMNYPAKLATGLKIRCKYTAYDSLANRDVCVNLYLHKVLV